jgi:23S rRNA (cytidine1920-2'-O)/16S rRNA (cytidine1409-2'-O)-methyltransferase
MFLRLIAGRKSASMLPRRPGNQCEHDHVPFHRVKRVRIDTLLSERGMFASRSRAAASVLAGDVLLLPERRRVEKPGQLVPEDVELEVVAPPPFVSRGGVKLANALAAFEINVSGKQALDIGASTGGFTDCLLQNGAGHVIAVDVAYGELDWRLRSDARVTVIERTNARSLTSAMLPYRPGLIVIDASFISLSKLLPAVLGCAADRFDCLALVKPQFEVGRGRLGKGGVVRDPDARRQALVDVGLAAQSVGASVLGFASSGLPGPKGNLESFVWLAEQGRGGVADLERAAREVEP